MLLRRFRPWATAALLVLLAGAPATRTTGPQGAAGKGPEEAFAFALVADVQYADKADAGARRYASSLERLEAAVVDWSDEELAFTVQLGDLIDGSGDDARERAELARVLERLDRAPRPVRHVVGNHCLELPRGELERLLGLESTWYAFSRGPWRFLVVDALWLSPAGRAAGGPLADDARRFLELHEEEAGARPWNGALGPAQRTWLRDQLELAQQRGERVVVFSHLPVLAASADPATLAWDHADVLAILERAPAFHAWIAGHHHAGGYAEVAGRHFLTLAGMVEAPPGGNAYAVVRATADALVVDGRGVVADRRLEVVGAPVPAGAFVPPPSEAAHPPRTEYLGREVAATMHWRGAEWLLRETREEEEAPRKLLAALQVEPGETVVDLGCGNGFHTLRLAEAVGPGGHVFGVDIQPEMLRMLEHRATRAGVENVTPVLATALDPGLAPASADLVLLVDVYHELDRPVLVLDAVRRSLRAGGRVALVEFRAEDEDVPIKPEHKLSVQQAMAEFEANGFALERRYDELPWQHLLVFRPRW